MEAKVRSCMYFKLEIKFQRVFGDAGGRRGRDELREEHGHTHCCVWNSGRQEAGVTARDSPAWGSPARDSPARGSPARGVQLGVP